MRKAGKGFSEMEDGRSEIGNRWRVAGGGSRVTRGAILATAFAVMGATGFAQVRISQLYTAGGTTSATYLNDFVELYNAGSAPQTLSGWSLQYASATSSTWSVQSLSGTIQPKSYFLVSFASNGAVGSSLPAIDLVGSTSINLSTANGKVALVSATTALAVTNPTVGVLDLIGYGTANGFEGTVAPGFSLNTRSLIRKDNGETDSNNNFSDFSVVVPAPRNSATAVNPSIVTGLSSLNPFSTAPGVDSDPQNFTVIGFGLSTSIAVTAPPGFEISSDGTNYSPLLNLPSTGGTVFVRIPSGATSGSSLSGNITLASSPALGRTVAVSGTVTAANSPAVTCIPTSLTGFSTYAGSVSTAQTIMISGSNLTDTVTVTAGAGYEVSSDGVIFSSSVSLPQTAGSLPGTLVYVRVAGTATAGALPAIAASVSSTDSPTVGVSGAGTVVTPFLSLALSPNPVNEGASATGTITLPQARVTDLSVSITSANTNSVTVPANVTIPAGTTSATFQASSVDNPTSFAEASSSVSVNATGLTGASVTLTVNNSTVAPIRLIALNGSGAGNTVTQDFNGLGINAITGVIPASNGVIVSLGDVTSSNMNGWYAAKNGGTGASATTLSTNTNSSTGTLYNFGASGSPDRALGAIATGTTAMTFGALLTNGSAGAITNVRISVKGEFWRSSTSTSNVLTFGYGIVDGTTVTTSNFLTAANGVGGMAGLDIVGPAPVASNGALDGTLAANQTNLASVSVPLVLLAGQNGFIRWQDIDDGGNDAGLAIDDFVLTYDVDTSLGLSSFSPGSGAVDTTVTISGANFTNGIPVRFNGTAATEVTVSNSTTLTAKVPSGASTGYLSVGSGAGAVTNTNLAFVVGSFRTFFPGQVQTNSFGSVTVGNEVTADLTTIGDGLPGTNLAVTVDSADFQVGTANVDVGVPSAFASVAEMAAPGGAVDSDSVDKIVFRFAPGTSGSKTATATLTSAGVVVGRLALSGSATGIPNVSGLTSRATNGSASLSWTNAASFTEVFVLAQAGGFVTSTPDTNGTANSVFGQGTLYGSAYLVYRGTGTNVTVTGLTNRVTYGFKVFNSLSGLPLSSGASSVATPFSVLDNVITQWNFNGASILPSQGQGTLSNVGSATIKGTFVSGTATDPGIPNEAVSVSNWNGSTSESAGLQFNVSIAGKKDIKISWDVQPSSSGPKHYRLLYTTNSNATNPAWTQFSATGPGTDSGLFGNLVGTFSSCQVQADLSGVTGAQNNPNFAFRLVAAHAPGTSGYVSASGSSVAAGGTLRLDMVTVTGVEGNFNSAPTNIGLSANTLAENNAENAVIGILSSTDPDAGDTATYSLVTGSGDTDNGFFNISGDNLRASAAFNFEAKSSYSIRVRTTDSANNTFEKVFTITVTNVDEGTTFAGWSGGATLDATNLAKYAIGGASSLTANDGQASTVGGDATTLTLTAIVRTDDNTVTITGEASSDLGSGWSSTGVTVSDAASQAGVPQGCTRKVFSVTRGSDAKKFIRIKATK